MFVVLSKFAIANDMAGAVKDAFQDRPHLVDREPGFVRLEVLCPQDEPNEIWLVTYWEDQASFETWHRSHKYHASHRGKPKGLKVVPKSTQLRFFRQICS